ncbi:hypothetical protein MNBD_BACTEROID05-980, partial [hydrothermal vent metagenome]
ATTFVVQLVGPPLVKYGITKAGERGRNVTKEDVIESLKVSDIMDKNFIPIQSATNLHQIIQIVKKEDAFNYPVVDNKGSLYGVITMKELKDALFENDLENFILAGDISIPARFVLFPDQPLDNAFEIFNKRALEFLPVIDNQDSKIIVGIVEYRYLKDEIDKRMLSMHGEND